MFSLNAHQSLHLQRSDGYAQRFQWVERTGTERIGEKSDERSGIYLPQSAKR